MNRGRLVLQVIQLRKACSHPYLFDGVEPEPFQEGEHIVEVPVLGLLTLFVLNIEVNLLCISSPTDCVCIYTIFFNFLFVIIALLQTGVQI